jgi:hypothetical protein
MTASPCGRDDCPTCDELLIADLAADPRVTVGVDWAEEPTKFLTACLGAAALFVAYAAWSAVTVAIRNWRWRRAARTRLDNAITSTTEGEPRV